MEKKPRLINRWKNRALLWSLGALLLFAGAFSHQRPKDCPTPLSLLDLLHAIVSGRLDVDGFQSTPYVAEFGRRHYSDKAPGTAALALGPFLLAAGVIKLAGGGLGSNAGWLLSSWVACAGSIGIITASGAAALFAWLRRQVSPQIALVTTLALFLGAAPLPDQCRTP
jgi:hypothetical protein